MPKISVIVPIYNVASFLEEGVDSILCQTYKNLEIILVNDGSTDGSANICDRLAQQNTSIVVLHLDNRGVSSARNKGIERASGDYITFVDPDDIIDKDMIKLLYENLSDNDCEISVCSIKRFNDGDPITYDIQSSKVSILTGNEAIGNMLYRKDIALGPVAKLYKTGLLKENYFNESLRIAEDADLNYRVLSLVNRVAVDSVDKYHYRQRIGSAIKSDFSLKKMDGIIVFRRILKDVEVKFPHLVNAAKNRLFLEAVFVIQHTYQSKQFLKEFEKCVGIVKELRHSVMYDRQSQTRIRQYALLSMNISLLVYAIRTMNRVKA